MRGEKHELLVSHACLKGLTWDDVMQVSPVLNGASEHAKREFLRLLTNNVGGATALAMQSANLFMNSGRLIVEFSKGGHHVLKTAGRIMQSAGRDLPILLTANGKTLEIARIAGTGAQLASTATAVTGMVVLVAHMISGADNAQKLNEANKKLDFLIAARRIDQCARMEAVFRQAKELMALPWEPEIQRDLHRLGIILHELRAAWRAEVRHKLSQIDLKKPEDTDNWFMKAVRWALEGNNAEKGSQTVYQNMAELHLLNVSLALHISLALASNTIDAYASQSLPEELAMTQRLLDEVASLRQRVNEKHQQALTRMLETEDAFRRTIDVFTPIANLQNSSARLTSAVQPTPQALHFWPFRLNRAA